MKVVDLFGHKVELHRRKGKHFLETQAIYREILKDSSELKYFKRQPASRENENKIADLSSDCTLKSFYYRVKMLSDSLSVGVNWCKFWRWHVYRKFSQSYITNNIDLQTLESLVEEISIMESGERQVGEEIDDFIPLDEMRVKAFVHKWAGIPYDAVTEQNIVDFFDSIQFAGEMLRIQVEGGSINLTKEDEMAYHLEQIRRARERGWLGKNAKKPTAQA